MEDAGMKEVKSILFEAMRARARVRYGDASTRPSTALEGGVNDSCRAGGTLWNLHLRVR